ncbi:unnamed protein product [Ceutorhynchus assimilis]|uniref:Survival of motor neuron-related-splicing factor 30 n=1 Tax=Ceutorhynchus assimilis TaxID=467358 RepID=A0A9N9QMT8_9CUCU|nr:unnamed protein product [Ceutorhynchus assimilis]
MSSNTILGIEWNLSPDGLDLITSKGTVKDPKQCLTKALDSDLKSIGKSALANLTSSSKMVLQIAKIRNVAAPKANEQSQAAPRMLKLTLTDGDGYVQAIEVGPVTSLNRDKTAPGTKCLVDGAKFTGGFLLIDNSNFKVLGGRVEHLYDKWQVAKNVKKDHLIGSSGGAPPWVPFGHKLAKLQETTSKEAKEVKDEASEFELQRKEAIMEVSSGAVKKTFGGRVRQNVVSMPQQQKYVKNVRKSFRHEDEEEKPQRPLEKVSLFSFLEDKLPQTSASTTKQLPHYNLEKQQFNKSNNYDSRQNGYVQTNNTPRNQHNNNYHSQNQDGYGKQSRYSKNNDVANSYQKPRSLATEQRLAVQTYNQDGGYKKQSNDVTNGYQKSRGLAAEEQNQDGGNRKQSNYSKSDVVNNYKKPTNVATEPKYNNRNSREQYQNITVEDRKQNVNNLSNSMSKMSINSEFATRTLRNHLNLPTTTVQQQVAPSAITSLNVGDQCMAKYWEDGKLYPASIAAVTDRTYAVRFQGYGNIEEVLRQDCFPVNQDNNYQRQQQRDFRGNSLEFRNNRRRN